MKKIRFNRKHVLPVILVFGLMISSCKVFVGPEEFIRPVTSQSSSSVSAGIKVTQGAAAYNNGSTYDFGSLVQGSLGTSVTFTITNTSAAAMSFTTAGPNYILPSGTNASDFTVTSQPGSSSLAAGASVTFAVRFNPTALGTRNAAIVVSTTNTAIPNYTINITGLGTAAPAPLISVKQSGTPIASGTGTFNFGSAVTGSNTGYFAFTVFNTGTAALSITSVTLSDNVNYTKDTTAMSASVAAGGSTTFSVQFNPASTGSLNCTVTIANNDATANPYTFALHGTGTATPQPSINVKQGISALSSGTGLYDFGSITTGSSSSNVVFTIENIGTANLTLTTVTLSDNTNFTADTTGMLLTVTPGSNTSFTVRFNPAATGAKSATVSIANNDGTKNPYTFTAQGTGLSPAAPEINLKQNVTQLASGTGSYDFGSVINGNSSAYIDFTIENTGTANLVLSSINLSDATHFTIDQTATSLTVTPGSNTTFKVKFNPAALGVLSATVTVVNNDSDESNYTFSVSGTGTALSVPEINIRQGAANLISGTGQYDFGNAVSGGSSGWIDFTIENTGTGPLNISTITLSDNTNFSKDLTGMLTIVPAAGNTTFKIKFNPTAVTSYNVTVTISNDDSDEATYTFAVLGAGTAPLVPEINVKQNVTNLLTGSGVYDFGNIASGSSSGWIDITIENTGTGTLNITSVTLLSETHFSKDLTPLSYTVTAGGSTTFKVKFNPTLTGLQSTTVTIVNDDADESSYSFVIQGTGTVPAPEINIKEGATDRASGYSVNWGRFDTLTPSSHTFTIHNTGGATLNVSSITSSNAAIFPVSGSWPFVIPVAGSANYTVQCMPTGPGSYFADIHVYNDDSDESDYLMSFYCDGKDWATINTAGFSNTTNNVELALNGSNVPHVMYIYGTNAQVTNDTAGSWTALNGGGWSATSFPGYSIFADATFIYTAFYHGGGFTTMKYNGSWSNIASGSFTTNAIASPFVSIMAIGGTGYIAYNNDLDQIAVKYDNAGVWTDLGTTGFPTNGSQTKIKLRYDPNSALIWLAFTSSTGIQVKKYNGTSWVDAGRASMGITDQFDMDISSSGPSVVVCNPSNSNYPEFKNYGGEAGTTVWASSVGGLPAEYCSNISMRFNSSDEPFVAYQLSTAGANKMLKYGAGWVQVGSYFDTNTGAASDISMDIGSDGTPFAAFIEKASGKITVRKYY